jgi:hypothetical protein
VNALNGETILRFAKVAASSTASGSGSAVLELDTGPDESSADDCELWGHAPLLYAPVAPDTVDAVTDADHCEAIFWDLGDERVVIATKDRRWQIEVAEGEVVLRAMGAVAPAYVHLKPDGTATIKATAVNMGPTLAPTQAFLRGTAFVAALNTWLVAHDTYIVIPVPTAPQTATYTAATATFVAALTASLSTIIKGE